MAHIKIKVCYIQRATRLKQQQLCASVCKCLCGMILIIGGLNFIKIWTHFIRLKNERNT